MKIIVVGATGTIGSAVVRALEARHEIVRVAHSRGDFRVDFSKPESIEALYENVGPFVASPPPRDRRGLRRSPL